MGQYYCIVNLDKSEYLHPHRFGNGLKLLEFTSDGYGTMAALGILLADGNGRGGGDLCHNGVVKDVDESVEKTFTSAKPEKDESIVADWRTQGKHYQSRVPTIVGSWAGDRIVIAGDYADEDKFLTADQLRQWKSGFTEEEWRKIIESRGAEPSLNLYQYAHAFMKDISEEVIMAMAYDQYMRREIIFRLLDGFCTKDNKALLDKLIKRYDCATEADEIRKDIAKKYAE